MSSLRNDNFAVCGFANPIKGQKATRSRAFAAFAAAEFSGGRKRLDKTKASRDKKRQDMKQT